MNGFRSGPSREDRYVERPRLEKALAGALRSGFNVLVYGEDGSGRSSLVTRVLRAGRRADVAGVVDGAVSARDTDHRVDWLDWAADGGAGGVVGHLWARWSGHAYPDAFRAADQQLSEAVERLAQTPVASQPAYAGPRAGLLVVTVDNVGKGAFELFGRQRDALWELPAVWVVITSPTRRAEFARPPASEFFEAEVSVGELSTTQAEELLRRRAEGEALPGGARGFPEGVVALVKRQGLPLYPGALLEAARRAITLDLEPRQLLELHTDVATRASALGRSEATAASILASGREVSASDDWFLGATGWSRQRASQVLHHLEEEGLAVSRAEPDGPGRPRRVFRLTDLFDERTTA